MRQKRRQSLKTKSCMHWRMTEIKGLSVSLFYMTSKEACTIMLEGKQPGDLFEGLGNEDKGVTKAGGHSFFGGEGGGH